LLPSPHWCQRARQGILPGREKKGRKKKERLIFLPLPPRRNGGKGEGRPENLDPGHGKKKEKKKRAEPPLKKGKKRNQRKMPIALEEKKRSEVQTGREKNLQTVGGVERGKKHPLLGGSARPRIIKKAAPTEQKREKKKKRSLPFPPKQRGGVGKRGIQPPARRGGRLASLANERGGGKGVSLRGGEPKLEKKKGKKESLHQGKCLQKETPLTLSFRQ